MQKKALGRGLSALMPEADTGGMTELAVESIRPNPYQPRRGFDAGEMQELVESIRAHGVLQPIVVRPSGEGYELIAGERRWRAAAACGHKTVPAVVRECSDRQLMELALVENLQRADLNAMEEAGAFWRLVDEFGLKQEDVAERVGKSRPAVANALRLLQLPLPLQDMVRGRALSAGHARALLPVADEQLQVKLGARVVEEGLSVRQTELLAQSVLKAHRAPRPATVAPEVAAIQEQLEGVLGTRVRISGGERGAIEIKFYSREDLTRIVEVLLGMEER
ncbi:MAG TPA: chromosome partitioning protein ParB [Clostridiales bacterium UBA8153]|nr:chromosome partitioning protein ParB [Clostridiales bacterium UBA8153]